MNSELELLKSKLAVALQARRMADQNLEQKSLEIYNLKQDLVSLQTALGEAKEMENQQRNASDLFSNNIQEELKTPLNAILGLTHILQTSDLTAKQQEDQIALIKNAAEILNTMVTDVLDYSIKDKGDFVVNNEKFDVVKFMEGVQQAYTLQLDGTPITMPLEMDSGFDKLLIGDKGVLRKILSRIIQHSYKYTREGYIYLRTRIVDRNSSQVSVRFEVEDTGIGIDKEKIKDIFTPFESLYTSAQSGRGGMGLAYVKKIVELLDGDIHVSSRLGTGTKYSVLLTFEETNDSMRVASENFKTGMEKLVFEHPILLVEDNPLHQKYMATLFDVFGNAHVLADNSLQAIELARTKAFSLVFMDMHMPKMDGVALGNAIRKFGNMNSTIPIVGMSGTGYTGDPNALQEAGVLHVLKKPFHPYVVQDILKELGARDMGSENPESLAEERNGPSEDQLELAEANAAQEAKANVMEQVGKEGEVEPISANPRTDIIIDEAFIQEQYGENVSEAYQSFEMYLHSTPDLLNDMKYCERLSQVASIAKKLIPNFQKVGLGSFTNELNILVELAENNQHQDLNEKVDTFISNAYEAMNQVKLHYTKMKNDNSKSV